MLPSTFPSPPKNAHESVLLLFLCLVGKNLRDVFARASGEVSSIGDLVGLGLGAALVSKRPSQLGGGGTIVSNAVVDEVLELSVAASVDGQILKSKCEKQRTRLTFAKV